MSLKYSNGRKAKRGLTALAFACISAAYDGVKRFRLPQKSSITQAVRFWGSRESRAIASPQRTKSSRYGSEYAGAFGGLSDGGTRYTQTSMFARAALGR